jgi:hypothetical protein
VCGVNRGQAPSRNRHQSKSQEKNLTAAVFLTIVLLLTGPLAAQNVGSNKVAIEPLPPAPAQAIPVPSSARPGRVFDKKFLVVMAGLGGAESLRFTTRKLVLDNEFAAGAPWVTSLPSNQHLVAKDLALYSSEFLVAYELKRTHSWLPGDRIVRRLWWAYPAAMTALHIKNAVGNIRTQAPGGCTSVECAMQPQWFVPAATR